MRNLMLIVSVVFHPLLSPTYFILVLYITLPSLFSPIVEDYIPYFVLLTFLTTGLIPGVSILVMKFTKRISSMDISNREERLFPFIAIAGFYGCTTYLYHAKLHVPSHLVHLLLMMTILVILLTVISIRKKVSVHSAAIWGITGVLTALLILFSGQCTIYILIIAYAISGLTASSRLYLNRHNPLEIWIGSLTGYFVCLIGTMIIFN